MGQRLRGVLAVNLRRLRRACGLSQEELAGRARLNRNYVGMIEREANAPTVDVLERLAEVLGVRTPELLDGDEARRAVGSARCDPVRRKPPEANDAGSKSRFDVVVWPFDPAAWDCMQRAAGGAATGDPDEAWMRIDQGLLFTYMQQQQRSLPTLAEDRAEKRRVLKDFDTVLSHLCGDASPSDRGLPVNVPLFDLLVREAMYQLRPGEPRLPENRRGESVTLHAMLLLLRGPYRDVQGPAQERILELLKQAGQALGSLRELLAASLAADAAGRGPGLAARAFVDGAAAAYEIAYGIPAASGGKEAAGESGPAVRFVEAVADEARKARTISPSYTDPLRAALRRVTRNTINRLLAERSGRRAAG